MNRVRPGSARNVEQLVDVEIAGPRLVGAERIGFIRITDVRRRAIRIGIDRDRPDLHLPARTHHPNGDLAAIGYQNLHYVEDRGWLTRQARRIF